MEIKSIMHDALNEKQYKRLRIIKTIFRTCIDKVECFVRNECLFVAFAFVKLIAVAVVQ